MASLGLSLQIYTMRSIALAILLYGIVVIIKYVNYLKTLKCYVPMVSRSADVYVLHAL